MEEATLNNDKKYEVDRATLNKVQWRSWAFQAGFNYEIMGGMGYCFMVIPALKKLYPDKQDLKEALERNIVLFNTTGQCAPFIAGIALSMEEEYANKRDFDPSAINSVKVSLMGPLAGIGDAFFQGVLRIVASAIGVGMVMQGNALGVLLALIAFNVPSLFLRIKGLYVGFDLGRSLLIKISESNIMQRISMLGSIVGLMVVGGMVASMIGVSTSLEFATNSGVINVQSLLDSIAPKLLPLGVFAVMYKLVKSRVKATYILYGTLAAGIILTWLGIFNY